MGAAFHKRVLPRFASLLLVGLLLPLWGCKTKPPRYPILPVYHSGQTKRFKDGNDLHAALRLTQDNYRRKTETLRIAIERTLKNGSTLRSSFRAVLRVERPRSLHLTIYTSMRIKILDVLVVGNKQTVKFRTKKTELVAVVEKLMSSLVDDLKVINRFDPQPQVDRRTIEETISLRSQTDPTFSLFEYSGDRLRRQWSAYAASLAVTRLEDHYQGDNIRTVLFGGFENHQGVILPRKVMVTHEGALTQWTSIEVLKARIDGPPDSALKKK